LITLTDFRMQGRLQLHSALQRDCPSGMRPPFELPAGDPDCSESSSPMRRPKDGGKRMLSSEAERARTAMRFCQPFE
jgi:hypothetical protein